MKPIIINVESYMVGSKIVIAVEKSNSTIDRNNFSHDCCHHCENTKSLAATKPANLKMDSAAVDIDSKKYIMDFDTFSQINTFCGEIGNLEEKTKDFKKKLKNLKKENENLKKKQKKQYEYINFLEKKCNGLKLYIELLDKYYHNDFSEDFWKSVSKLTEFFKMIKENTSESNK